MDERENVKAGTDEILRAAAHWTIELSSTQISPRRIAQWRKWLAASDDHQRAFDRIQSALSAVDRFPTQELPWPTDAEVANDAYDGAVPVEIWRTNRPDAPREGRAGAWINSKRKRGLGLAIGLAASLVVALATPLAIHLIRSVQFGPAVTIVETRAGEIRDVSLGDGSTVSVGARTVLWATLSREAREITLERGEAFFDVAKDPKRPFTVKIGATTVAAVGTAFNVRRAGQRVVVGVAEGVVKVEAAAARAGSQSDPRTIVRTARVTVGQQLSINAANGRATLRTVDAGAIAAWREGLLRYQDEPLHAVVADVIRYSARDILIADPAVGDLRVTGTVFANDIDSWLQSLEAALPVRAVHGPDGAVRLELRLRDAAGQ